MYIGMSAEEGHHDHHDHAQKELAHH